MPIDSMLGEIRQELQRLGSPEGVATARRFFKEDIDPYGIGAPDIKNLEQTVYRQVKHWKPADRNNLCTALFKSGKLEEGGLAVYLYARFAKQCQRCEFQLFERWIDRYVHNWSHTDGIGTLLIAASIRNDPALIADIHEWTSSKNRWKRRAAAVSLVKEARKGNFTGEIFGIASKLMEDPDEMVQKGTGWLLKETYPPKPRETVRFLLEWNRRTSRLLLRYAAEKMSAQDKQKVLNRA
jgi:3-methyladenine DNA glycosylase AlkD